MHSIITLPASLPYIAEANAIEQRIMHNPWNISQFSSMIHSSSFFSVCISHTQNVSGYCLAQIIIDECELLKIAVDPNYQHHGLASALLKNLFEYLTHHSIKKIFLEVDHTNTNARLLYKKNGFVETGIRKDYYGEGRNGVLMTKSLEG